MSKLTMASLFSGSGGFELAAILSGIEPIWASEVAPFPIRVTTKRFPNMKHYGDVSKINGAEVPPVDIITFGSPCFPAGTLVLTARGYIPIEDVICGDEVLTHTGEWHKVTDVGWKFDSTIILKGNHYGLECTRNHPIYSANTFIDYRRKTDGKYINSKKQLCTEKSWEEAQYMEGKLWAVPLHIESLEGDYPKTANPSQNEMPEMNADFWYFVGRWLGDGWVRDGQRPDRPEGERFATIIVCDGLDKEKELVEAVSKITKNYSIERGKTGVKVKLNGRLLCDWLVRNFGRHAEGKKIAPWVYGIDSVNREALLHGLMDSDGNKIEGKEAWNITTCSKVLANGIRLLAEQQGFSTTIHRTSNKPTTVIEGRVVNQKPFSYQVRLTADTGRTRTHLRDDHHSWYRVRSVTPTCELKKVYNIAVEGDNSYIAEGIVVHNCQDLSMAGRRAGIGGAKSSLFYEAIRIVKEMREATNGKQPRYIVFENVYGAFFSNDGEDFRCILGEVAGIKGRDISIPRCDQWLTAGEIMADDFSIAWRGLDAAGWGVPQRRKRVFLVGDFNGKGAGKILFESEGRGGDPAESIRTGERDTRTASNRVAYAIENHAQDGRVKIAGGGGYVLGLHQQMGTGGNNVPLVMLSE